MFGSCLDRNDYLHKLKMFDNADSWLDRLKRITDYEINKWNSYEETKQDKFSVDTSKLTFNNNILSVKESFFNSIVETRLANFSSSFFNGAVAELQADIAQEILRLEGRLINDDDFNAYIDSKFIGYEKGNALRQYITEYVTGYTYSTQEIINQLSYKQGQLSWGKGVKVNNDMEVSVNIDNEFSITRYLDIDRFVHINPADDSELVDGWDYVKEIDWQQLYHENKETQAFTVKNLLRIDYDEDTKIYTLGVPYTNRLVDADYAITSRTILRELRSEYEKKIFVLGDSIQLVNIDWFVHKFQETYEEYSHLTVNEIRSAYFGRDPEYPQLKTKFDAWYEIEYGPTAVDRITDLMTDCYQRAITIAPNGMLDKNADGSDLGENYWRGEHTPYLYTTDGEGHYYTPDKYSFPTTFEVKKKVVELHDRIDSLDAEVTSSDGTNVQVKVTEVDGKITAVNITTDNTINSTDLQTALSDYVTLATTQTITGNKTFSGSNTFSNVNTFTNQIVLQGVNSMIVGSPDGLTKKALLQRTSLNNTNLIVLGNTSDTLELRGIGTRPTYNSNEQLALLSDVTSLPEPMIFKGTVGSGGTVEWSNLDSSSASNKGWTYKVITDNNTAPICKVGDTIISDSTTWVVIPSGDEPSGTVTNIATASESNSHLTLTTTNNNPITSTGTITAGVESGYSIPSITKQTEWDSKVAGVQLNSVDLTKDSNNKVNITVPQVYRFV